VKAAATTRQSSLEARSSYLVCLFFSASLVQWSLEAAAALQI